MLKIAITLLLSIGLAHAAVLPGWSDSSPNSDIEVDHSDWQAILDDFVFEDNSGQTYFAYDEVTTAAKAALTGYINSLEQINPLSLNPSEEKAYWFNLYNALTVEVILDNYPVDSIKDIGGAFGGLIPTGPWNLEVTTVNNQSLSLNNIEHDIVRPKFNDFRIHFAVNCAAKGCPNLSKTAFTGENIETLLDEATVAFVNHPRGARVENRRLTLSSIFDWYLTDFVDDEDQLQAFLPNFAEPPLKAQLTNYDGRIRYEYDWSLNEVVRPQ